MPTEPASGQTDEPITHGICPACMRREFSELGMSLYEFLSRFPVSIVVVDADGLIQLANAKAERLLGKTPDLIQGHLSGDVFECVHAAEPGGCGQTIHCSGCTIRIAVMDTLHSGVDKTQVPASLRRDNPDGPQDIDLLISTEKKGAIVLLRIDEMTHRGPALAGPHTREVAVNRRTG